MTMVIHMEDKLLMTRKQRRERRRGQDPTVLFLGTPPMT
jgi:hypothetical protein